MRYHFDQRFTDFEQFSKISKSKIVIFFVENIKNFAQETQIPKKIAITFRFINFS